jgi:hypothetical protein
MNPLANVLQGGHRSVHEIFLRMMQNTETSSWPFKTDTKRRGRLRRYTLALSVAIGKAAQALDFLSSVADPR